jgi:hypothetical protein
MVARTGAFWDVQWPIGNGKARHRKFSVKKHGERGAFLRALRIREKVLKTIQLFLASRQLYTLGTPVTSTLFSIVILPTMYGAVLGQSFATTRDLTVEVYMGGKLKCPICERPLIPGSTAQGEWHCPETTCGVTVVVPPRLQSSNKSPSPN